MNKMFQPVMKSRPGFDQSDDEDLRDADILIVTGYYHPEPTGSAPPISDLSFWLAENGARPRVLTPRPSYPKCEVTEGYRHGERDQENVNGVQVHRLPADVSRRRGLLGRFKTEFGFFLRLCAARLSGKVKPSGLVICVCPSIFVAAAARFFVAPGGTRLCIVHDIQSGLGAGLGMGDGRLLRLLRAIEARTLDGCDRLIALSDEMAEEIRALGVRTPITVVPPQVDVRELGGAPEPFSRRPTLLYSGNLGRKQGLDQVLALAAELQARGSPARIVVRGEGSERADLQRHAAEEGLANIEFQDLARRDELRAAFAEGAIHLVPQHPNGASFCVPSKVFSIMAAERPFLATAEPGSPLARIALASGGGLCVTPYDSEALADAAEALLHDPRRRRRMGAAGRRYVERNIDREVACRRIWNALLGRPAAAAPVRVREPAWTLRPRRLDSISTS